MADRYTTIYGDQIDATALGAGLEKDVNDNLKVNVDDSSIECGGSGLQVKALGIVNAMIAESTIEESKLNISNSATDGYYLKYNTVGGMTWATVDALTGNVQDEDVICNEVPAGTIGSGNTVFTLANTPVLGTVQVYLNGILQSPGSGKEYTISGAVITFAKAPKANNKILVSYIVT